LLAKGAFEVSAVRKNGATQFIKIKSLAGQPCLVKTGLISEVKAYGKRAFKITQQANDVVAIDLKKGEEVVLYTGTKPSSFVISKGRDDGNYNRWGLQEKQGKGQLEVPMKVLKKK
jgi:alpha-L-fucosidase 2